MKKKHKKKNKAFLDLIIDSFYDYIFETKEEKETKKVISLLEKKCKLNKKRFKITEISK